MISKPQDESEEAQQTGFPQTKLNKVRVYKQRGRYDYATVHSIVDSTFVSHVAFTILDEDSEPTPINMPLTAVLAKYDASQTRPDVTDEELETQRQAEMQHGPMELYLHGNAAVMLYKAILESESGSVRVCITSTKVDGVVLCPTPNGHSLNYRAAILHGTASLVPDTDTAKKRWAMRLLTNHMYRGRWGATYPVLPSAIEKVRVLEVSVRSGSAKVRAQNFGPFDPEPVDVQSAGGMGVWSGVVPLYEVLGEPVRSAVQGVGGDERGLVSVQGWRAERNQREQGYAVGVAQVGT